jgi:hypothetical protein
VSTRELLRRSVLTPLTWLGRQGARAIAAVVFIGIAVPPVDALLKPFVTEAIFVLLVIAFARVDPAILRGHLGRPAIVLATIIRRIAGPPAITRHKAAIDGANILFVFVFVAAVMEHVAARILAAPLLMIGLAALAFAVCFAVLGLTFLVFAGAGRERAFVLALMCSQRNMGLMLAATGGALPDLAWLYFALSQFPIYLSPQLLTPLARRLVAERPPRRAPTAA